MAFAKSVPCVQQIKRTLLLIDVNAAIALSIALKLVPNVHRTVAIVP